MTEPIQYVEALARALDGDDYETVASVLSPDVEYAIGNELHRGKDAVVASYRTASELAHRLFDRVVYGHEILPADQSRPFRVRYSDDLTVGDETLRHIAEQRVTAVEDVGVTRILNVDVPGERERVDAFMTRHGLSREG